MRHTVLFDLNVTEESDSDQDKHNKKRRVSQEQARSKREPKLKSEEIQGLYALHPVVILHLQKYLLPLLDHRHFVKQVSHTLLLLVCFQLPILLQFLDGSVLLEMHYSKVWIGRGSEESRPDFDLRQFTNSKHISHQHAQVVYDPKAHNNYVLYTLGRNGTRVNTTYYKEYLAPIPLHGGDLIDIGHFQFYFMAPQALPTLPPPPSEKAKPSQ